jgi:hypothetical protein
MRVRHIVTVACPAVQISPLYLTNGAIFWKRLKRLLNRKCMFWFSQQLSVWNSSRFEKNSARYYHKCILVFMWSTRYACKSLVKLKGYRHISNNRYEISSESVPWEPSSLRRDGQTRHSLFTLLGRPLFILQALDISRVFIWPSHLHTSAGHRLILTDIRPVLTILKRGCLLRHVCPPVCMEHLGSDWTDFNDIWRLSVFRKSFGKIRVSLKSDKNDGTLR